jgi:hypothetical protein
MVQEMAGQISSFVSSLESRIDEKLSSLTLHLNSPEHNSPRATIPTPTLVLTFPQSDTSINITINELSEEEELAEVEKNDIEEQKKKWEKHTRLGPSGQPTFHLIKDPIKFPSMCPFVFILFYFILFYFILFFIFYFLLLFVLFFLSRFVDGRLAG